MASCKECIHKTVCAVYNDSLRETLERGGTMLCQCGEYFPADDVNNVEELCGGFEIKTEREKDMASCKDCIHDGDCGIVMEEHAEKCEVYANKLAVAAKWKTAGECAPSAEWQKEKEAEATTLKIKAAGYDVIKGIVGEAFEGDYPKEDVLGMIDGALRMEEAVMKTLI